MKKQIYMWLVAIFTSIFSTSLFTSCDNDDDTPVAISQSDIVGIWNGEGGSYNNDGFEFFEDGTAVRKYGNSSKLNKDNYKWLFSDGSLSLTDDLNAISKCDVSHNGSQLSFKFDGSTYFKTIQLSPESPSASTGDKKLVGEWWYRSSSSRLKKRYYCSNGRGYEKNSYDGKDYGLMYRGFKWSTSKNDQIAIQYDGDSRTFEYDYVIEDNKCTVTKGTSKESWTKHSDNVDESFDPTQKPFANNYLLNRNTGYYYQITKMTSGCNHAGSGDNMNDKFLHFFGSDGLLTTTGLRIVYFTPRWEGIDSYWADGIYTMSLTSGAYKYTSMAWCNGSSLDTYDGKLKISRSGSFTTYDYNDKDVELHVLVKAN